MRSVRALDLTRRALLARTGAMTAAIAGGGLLSALTAGQAWATLLPNSDPRAVVETAAGKVRGALADGIHIFRGVPYGAPTDGAARFMPPEPVAAWAGVRDTVDYGDQAPQQEVNLGRIVSGSQARRETSDLIPVWSTAQSEDCLNLNLWTPAVNAGGKRPVMVWLHPGGFEFGSANIAFSEGTNLARRGDVVVVAINHRLGALGHLDLAELGGDKLQRSGNLGLLDLLLGLRWVRDNIAAFGGDPDCVMIFGESGGARKVSTMLAMPGAKGLFHRAAIESGPGLRFPSNQTQAKRARYVLEELGMPVFDLRRLQAVPVDKLVAAGAAASARVKRETPDSAPFYENYGFTPVVGPDLPTAPFDPVAPEVSADVPVLIGTNRHEMSLAYTQDSSFDEVSEDQLLQQTRMRVGDRAPALVETYRRANPDASRRVLMLLIASDFSHRMDSITLAERKCAQHRGPIYMYRFDWRSPVLDGLIMAAHTYEIPHVFDNAQLCCGMTGGGPDAVALAAKMSSAWIAFARTGDPNTQTLPAWPTYDTTRRGTMLFNDVCQVADDPGGAERVAWRPILAERESGRST